MTSGTHRLVHLHRNVPGVLAAINRVLAGHGVNVEGQLLRTRDEFGCVLTDISSEYSEDVLAELRDAGHHPAAHPVLALTRARTRARRPGSPGRRALSRGFRYGMNGVWYAIGVTETWCR